MYSRSFLVSKPLTPSDSSLRCVGQCEVKVVSRFPDLRVTHGPYQDPRPLFVRHSFVILLLSRILFGSLLLRSRHPTTTYLLTRRSSRTSGTPFQSLLTLLCRTDLSEVPSDPSPFHTSVGAVYPFGSLLHLRSQFSPKELHSILSDNHITTFTGSILPFPL